MKNRFLRFLTGALVGATVWITAASAQVDVNASLERYNYLQYEPMLMEVTVTNRSARTVKLENRDGKPWLQLMVTKVTGEVIQPRAQMDTAALELEAGKSVSRTVNLAEMFFLEENTRCEIFVKLIMPLGQEKRIGNVKFFIGKGVTIWEETVGVNVPAADKPKDKVVEPPKQEDKPVAVDTKPKYSFVRNHGVLQKPAQPADNSKEETRTYALLRYATQGDNNFIYLRVSDPDKGIIYGCYPLGKGLPFYKPQARIDGERNLHVLFQTGARLHSYYRISPLAQVLEQAELTSNVSTPALERRDDGFVFLVGGERRPRN